MRKLLYLIAGLLVLPGVAVAQWFDPQLVLTPIGTFSAPVAITYSHGGDDRIFVTEQAGRIIVVGPPPGYSQSTFLDITADVDNGGEQGLLSTAFHPNYPNTPWFYVNYTADNLCGGGLEPSACATRIERYEVSGNPNVADANSGATLLEITQDYDNHNGGQLQFGPGDGHLYAGMGDGGNGGDPQCRAQSENSLLGKLLRLDVNLPVDQPPYYEIPADNPFDGPGFGEPLEEIWALGLRNPWRFSFDRSTGDLYIGDVGQSSREEVDFQPASSTGGENYGWRVMEGDLCFSSSTTNCQDANGGSLTPLPCNNNAYTDPIAWHSHSGGHCSITGGYVYRGDDLPALRGWYVYADYCSGVMWAAVNDGGWVVNELATVGFGVTSFGEDANGELYMTQNNTVFRFETSDAGVIFEGTFESL